ncbi:zinc-binding dehydrogenase [Kineococcus sp. SYSU DK003]|uniref:zinc-binding dehydrogenase n=1 Tax=Kineococcus sp. SYSU DK003 TaxID=3383124 RepID=UPI003D7E8B85
MPRTMRAQRLHVPTRTMTVEEVPVPEPGPGQVLVDVAYCGICHSDLGLLDGSFRDLRGPETITQGHEASGTVAALGEGVTGWAVGDRVIPAAGRPCRRCDHCRRGDLVNCDDILLMAFAYDGAWAEYTVAEAGGLTRVPDSVPLDQAALLADAVSTPFGAVVHTAAVRPGEAVGVWGVGGVGTHLVQLARLVGAVPVVAFDLDPAVRDRALAVGADLALDPQDPALRERIAEATDGHLLDVAFDAVGLASTFEQGLAMLAPRGRVVGVGLSGQEISLGSSLSFNLSRKQALGHLGYQNSDIGTLVKLLAGGRLDLSGSISAVVGLDEVEDGIRQLHERRGKPVRVLVQP